MGSLAHELTQTLRHTASDELVQTLVQIHEISEALASEVRALPPATWTRPTNCPPWLVRDLAAHVASTGFAFVANVRRGLAGSVDPAPSRSSPLGDDADPTQVADALSASTAEFLTLYDGLSDEQLERICYHRRGNRSVRWYVSHRLAELAFHRWDLLVSCGRPPEFPAAVARLLLPTLLESNAPRTYAAGLSKERGQGERFQLCVADDPTAQWLVTISPDALTSTRTADAPPATPAPAAAPALAAPPTAAARRTLRADALPAPRAADPVPTSRAAGADASDSDTARTAEGNHYAAETADLTITADAATLALLVYGRVELPAIVAAQRARAVGDAALIDRFGRIFPRP